MISINIFSESDNDDDENYNKLGSFNDFDDYGCARISINEKLLFNIESLVSTIAHELSHALMYQKHPVIIKI